MHRTSTLAVFAFTITASSSLWSSEGIEIRVRVISPQPAAEITIQREDDAQPRSFRWDQSSNTFRVTLPKRATSPGKKSARAIYTLVGAWNDGSEQVYLVFTPTAPDKIDLQVHHEALSYTSAALNMIEGNGPDYGGIVRKYFLARAFHRKWRFVNKQPMHQAAIRSARLWFDAAYTLSTRPSSFYAMDQEIAEIMENYERAAKDDADFNKRYRKHSKVGYVDGMMAQLEAAEFQIARDVPSLISQGKLSEASEWNNLLLIKYQKLSPEMQLIVEKIQGINEDVLQNNERFIKSRAATSGSVR